jgi:hypothetical protein
MTNVTFRLNPQGQGSLRKAAELKADKLKLICVDAKLATAAQQDAGAGAGGS